MKSERAQAVEKALCIRTWQRANNGALGLASAKTTTLPGCEVAGEGKTRHEAVYELVLELLYLVSTEGPESGFGQRIKYLIEENEKTT